MFATLIPVIGFLFQIILAVIQHVFSAQDKKTQAKETALAQLADAAKKGNHEAFFDAYARLRGA